ncbi:hypothetical protein ACHQM5_000257 [Ranunculus cassubicifolius]
MFSMPFSCSRIVCSGSQPQSGSNATQNIVSKPEIQFAPANPSVGGKASLQPKRTPVSEREIEAIMLGGCI